MGLNIQNLKVDFEKIKVFLLNLDNHLYKLILNRHVYETLVIYW